MEVFKKGLPLRIEWHLVKPEGSEFSVSGLQFILRYGNSRGRTLASGVSAHLQYNSVDESVMETAYLTWTFTAEMQHFVGQYDLELVVLNNGKEIAKLFRKPAFVLSNNVSNPVLVDDAQELVIESTVDFYKFNPIIPVVDGEHGYWVVNGEPILDDNGDYIYADHTMRYDPETQLIIIDEGRVDSQGQSIEQDIDVLVAIKATYDADHATAEADHILASSDHETASADHTQAVSDHGTASSDHEQASSDTSRAEVDHLRAGSDHDTASSDHTRANSDHSTAQSDHGTAGDDHAQAVADSTRAGNDHSTASSDHATASGDHDTASADHTQAVSDHGTAGDDHTQAGADHTRAENDHTTASTDHTNAASDHTRAGTDHSTAADDHTQAASDHSTAAADHTTAGTDHSTAASDHTTAGTDHTNAAADHTQAGEDHAQYLIDHASIANKADKDADAVVDNLASFDANGNPVDSGVSKSDIPFLNRALGKYDTVVQTVLSQAKAGKYVDVNGAEVSAAGYGISAPIQLNFGDILLVPSASAVPAAVSVISRVVTRTYDKVINYAYTYREDYPELYNTATADYNPSLVYTAVYDTSGETPVLTGWTIGGQTLEELPATHEVTDSYYGPLFKQAVAAMPSTGYYIYLCPQAMEVVISGYTATVDGGTCLTVGLGIFKNIVSNFLARPGQDAVAQSLCDLYTLILGLAGRLENLGDVKAGTIDCENLPKVCGTPMVIEGVGAPSVVPHFVGQRYHDTTSGAQHLYEAFAVTGSTGDWVLIK